VAGRVAVQHLFEGSILGSFREGSLPETGPCGGLEGAASANIPDRRADLAVAFRASQGSES
jgi:hypothetical protein